MAPPPGPRPKSPGPPGPPCSGPGPCCAKPAAAMIIIAKKSAEIFFIGGSPWGLTYDKRGATYRAESARVFAGRNDAAGRVETTLVVSAWRGRRWGSALAARRLLARGRLLAAPADAVAVAA